MAQSDLDICNLAIARIAGEPIDAIDENTPLGASCGYLYPQVRDTLLGGHRWVFAASTVQLARRAETPADCPAAYAFDLPNDLVGAVFAYRDGPADTANRVGANIINGYVASHASVLWVEYTKRRTEETWPVWFVELVRIALASELASTVQNQSLSRLLRDQAYGAAYDRGEEGGLLLAAKMADARLASERRVGGWDPGVLVTARFGNGYPDWDLPTLPPSMPPNFIDFP